MKLRGDALVLIGPSAALPHGSKQPQKLKEGDVILIDGGTKVEGYDSDVTRTGVLGKPSAKVQQVFEIVRGAQNAALDAAREGKLSGSVDDAARGVMTTPVMALTTSPSAIAWATASDWTPTSILT